MKVMNIIKVINAQRARIIHHYENVKEKYLKANAAKWFNKMCRLQHLAPNTSKLKSAEIIHEA